MTRAGVDSAVERAARLVGGVWGHLVGDAVGVPYEFGPPRPADEVVFGATGSHGQPAGTWSDDGGLMLALLDSLLSAGFDVEDQGRRSVAWWTDGAYTPDPGRRPFDIGGTTFAALSAIRSGTPAADAGPNDELACGNGSLMRILPIALVGDGHGGELDVPTLIDRSMRASRVTHGHPRAQVACALYVCVAARLLAGEADRDAAFAAATRDLQAALEGDRARLAALYHLLGHVEREGRGRVWDSLLSAWDAFAGADSYADTIARAVAYGNDTDTTAAIAGGLAGIYWTVDGIPPDWLAGMRGREIVGPLVDGLLALDGWKTSTTHPLRLDVVESDRMPGGRLGMTFLPGKQREGWTGMHWRDLEADVRRLRDHHEVDAFLLLVEDHELRDARVPEIAEVMAAHGIDLIRFPIRDMDITSDRDGLRRVLDDLLGRLGRGQTVGVACRGGLGRTGTIVGCLLRDVGYDAETAIRLTREARHDTIERDSQVAFVHGWEWPAREVAS